MVYARDIVLKLEREISTKQIILITGMRQVGKTTVLKEIFDKVNSSNKVIIDFENPISRKVFESINYDDIWESLKIFGITNTEKPYLFLDGIQYVPNIGSILKYLYDHWDVKVFCTGSSSFYLKNLFTESMAGRKIIFEMFPLTFSEFLKFKGKLVSANKVFFEMKDFKNEVSYLDKIKLYDEYMQFGGFPAVVLEEVQSRKLLLLNEIFTSYFEKDVRILSDFNDINKLRDLILLLAPRIGSKTDVDKLSKLLGITRVTLYNYLTFLEQTYFIHTVKQFSGSIDRQSAGSNKLFFCDSGILNILGRVSEGQLFEQSIFQNFIGKYKINYYNRNDVEIDFIIDSKVAIEVKYSMSQRDSTKIKNRSEKLHLKEYYVVTHEYQDYPDSIVATDL